MPVAGAREATHAGSWYTSSGAALATELDGWLEAVRVDAGVSTPKAIIAPHAG
jgi:AmmeMemoRadiSam system protein B